MEYVISRSFFRARTTCSLAGINHAQDIVTASAFDLLSHTEKNQLLSLLPETDRESTESIRNMFASENFRSCLSLYQRMLEAGALDTPASFSYPAAKKRRNQVVDPWKVWRRSLSCSLAGCRSR